jgi:hypothetical protein
MVLSLKGRACIDGVWNRGLRETLRCKRDEENVPGENYIMSSFIIYTPSQTPLRFKINEDELGRTCSKHGGDENYM